MTMLQQTVAKRGEESPRFSFALKPARKKLLDWFGQNPATHPWRLDFQRTRDPYFVWVSEIMLQQTVIKAVLPVYARFIREFPTVEALSKATEEQMRSAVRGLGYYRRFAFLHQAAKNLVAKKVGNKIQWPKTFADWKELPGVGDYTAAAVSSIVFNQPVAAVDGNVDRVLARIIGIKTPIIPGPTKKIIAQYANLLVDPQQPGRFNEAMMELGQKICRPVSPSCDVCPFAGKCFAQVNNLTVEIPAPKPKVKFVDVDLNLIVFTKGKKVFLHKRPISAKFLRESEGFATELIKGKTRTQDGSRSPVVVQPKKIRAIGSIQHSITKHRIKAQVFHALDTIPTFPGRWIHQSEVEKLLVSNLDRKAWRLFENKN